MWLSKQKPALFALKLNSILLPQFTGTLNIYPDKCQILTDLLFSRAFCQPYRVTAGTMGPMGECQLDSGDLYLLPLAVWPAGVLLATVWASWQLMGCPYGWFLPPPTPPIPPLPVPPHPNPPTISPTPSIINTDGRKGRQKIPWNSAIRDRG